MIAFTNHEHYYLSAFVAYNQLLLIIMISQLLLKLFSCC